MEEGEYFNFSNIEHVLLHINEKATVIKMKWHCMRKFGLFAL